MSTIPKRKASVHLFGAVQQPFTSFEELAIDALNQYCPQWNNLSDPASYIFPATFSFLNPDKSDLDIDLMDKEFEEAKKQKGAIQKELSSIEKPIIHRWSDHGEFMVFQTILALVQEKVQAPFLAIRGLNLGNWMNHFQTIFPLAPYVIKDRFKAMMREYDFVLIGPKIGIIVIEVKSSAFTKQKDFSTKNRNLPEQITKAVEQLQSFDLEFFQACSGLQSPPEIQLRRILFTPNLEKRRHEAWYNDLNEVAKKKVEKLLIDSGIIHWYKEDVNNLSIDSGKPALYSRLRQAIETVGFQNPQKIYESYGLIISGLASAVVLHNQTTMNSERLSTSSAILREADTLESQDPSQKLQKMHLNIKPKRQKLDTNPDEVVELHSKLVLLTPEQQNALNGPNRQLIIGAPGTGKTIILQAKALQLLKDRKRVLMFTTKSYEGKYQKLFEDHGFVDVDIRAGFLLDASSLIVEELVENVAATESVWETLEIFFEQARKTEKMPAWLTDFDAVLIDDVFDETESVFGGIDNITLPIIMQLMAISKTCEFRSKVIWIACDTCWSDSDGDISRRILDQIIQGEQKDYFASTLLHRVMRSSESVFQATYSPEVLQFLARKPQVGHKIHGFAEAIYVDRLAMTMDEMLLEIWKHTEGAVKIFRKEGFEYGHMAVIVGGENPDVYQLGADSHFFQNTVLYFRNKFQWCLIPVAEAYQHSPSSLTVDIWSEVSSLEWPIVIYIAMMSSDKERITASAAYSRYRSCSRATMKLFEIIACQLSVGAMLNWSYSLSPSA